MPRPVIHFYHASYVVNDDCIPLNYADLTTPAANIFVTLRNFVEPFDGSTSHFGTLNLWSIPAKDIPKCFTPTLLDRGFNTITLLAWDKDHPPPAFPIVGSSNKVRVVGG